MSEILCKLFLELAHVVPEGTKTFRELELEREVEILRRQNEDLRERVKRWEPAPVVTKIRGG